MNWEDQLISQTELFPEGKHHCALEYSDWNLAVETRWNHRCIDLEMHYSKPSLPHDFPKVTVRTDPFWAAIFIMVRSGSITMYGSKSEMSDLFLGHKIALRLMKLKRANLIWKDREFTFKARVKPSEKRLFKHIREHCETLVREIDRLALNKA